MSDSEVESEPDLDALTRQAAEAKLLASVDGSRRRGSHSSEESGDGADAGLAADELALLRAAEQGDPAGVRALLRGRPDLVGVQDGDGYTPLHRAVYGGHTEAAAALLEAGAPLAARTGDGWTPLHSAVRWNAVACARLLLLHGADPNAVTAGGLTPLMVAASAAEARDTTFLLLSTPGLQLHTTNASGETAAQIAGRNQAAAALFELTLDYVTGI